MALQLILGNSGAGKSHYLFEKIIAESMEYPNRQFLVIVPGAVYHADSEGSGNDASAAWHHEY